MSISVRARVVSVRPRGDDTFGITLGPGPKIFWFRTTDPPKLGELVHVADAHAEVMRVSGRDAITVLEGGHVSVIPDAFTRRVVAPQWVVRAHQIVRRPLMPFQAEGAGWLASRLAAGRGSILADEMGLGKSGQTLAALASVGATPAIIVCPPSVKQNWQRETRFLKPRLKVAVINGTRGRIPRAHIIVTNYAILRGRERQLSSLGAKTIVFDEGHLLKEPQPSSTHRAAVATRLAHRIGRPIILTGTVLLNRPEELWRLLHILDPHTWPSFVDFRRRYCTSPDSDEKRLRLIVTKHGQAKRLDELQALVAPYMLRRQVKRVLRAQLPPKIRKRVVTALEEVDRAHYAAAEKDVVAWIRGLAGDARALRAKRGQAVVKLNMLRRIAAIGKLRRAAPDYVRKWFEEAQRPLIIFAYHTQVLEGMRAICKRLGLKISTISGKDSDQKRQRAVDLFQEGFTDVFIAPIRSAGVGINLQARCSDILCLERLWTPALMNQAEARAWRMGQTRPVTVTYLDAQGTVDDHVAEVLEAKQVLIDTIVDDVRSPSKKQQTIETIDEVMTRVGGLRRDSPASPQLALVRTG